MMKLLFIIVTKNTAQNRISDTIINATLNNKNGLILNLEVCVVTLEESLSITTVRCDLATATHARKMHKQISI